MITIARIDERLIHGQVGYAWSVVYKSDAIMVIDNEISKDKFQISLLQMACPAGVKCFVCDEQVREKENFCGCKASGNASSYL